LRIFAFYLKRRRSSAALQNAGVKNCVGKRGHVLQCGSIMPLSIARGSGLLSAS
jgi:hypothetical protein